MYKRILVPLDGSKLAECALPHAEELTKTCDAGEITLVSVTEHILGYKPAVGINQPVGLGFNVPITQVPMHVGKMQKQAQRYLSRIAEGLEAKGFRVSAEVLLGKPAEKIISFAEDRGADIIVMSSHGRSGPSRWAYGSVTDQVLRASCVPVLMVRAPGCVPGI